MDGDLLKHKFQAMGSKLELYERGNPRRGGRGHGVDVEGNVFKIYLGDGSVDFQVIHLDRKDRHLVLMAKHDTHDIEKYLCGHDERHWFVAAVPEPDGMRADRLRRGVSTVDDAKEALKPAEAVDAQRRRKVKRKHRHKRSNKGFIRQGEWFFIAEAKLQVKANLILKNEPLSRGAGSKPHLVEQVYRLGGELVYVCGLHPNGVSPQEYQEIVERDPKARHWGWTTRTRDAEVYARGKVSHPDHATVELTVWHRVVMNEERRAVHAPQVVFLD